MFIKDFENYQVFENGSVLGPRGKFLKPDRNSNGYLRVTLSKNGITTRLFIHRLVAEHFIEKPASELPLCVNHKDGNRENNNVVNLEWVTWSYNCKDGWARGRDSSLLYLNFGR